MQTEGEGGWTKCTHVRISRIVGAIGRTVKEGRGRRRGGGGGIEEYCGDQPASLSLSLSPSLLHCFHHPVFFIPFSSPLPITPWTCLLLVAKGEPTGGAKWTRHYFVPKVMNASVITAVRCHRCCIALGRLACGAWTGLWGSQSQCGSECIWSLFCARLCGSSSLFSLFQLTGRLLACLFEPMQVGSALWICVWAMSFCVFLLMNFCLLGAWIWGCASEETLVLHLMARWCPLVVSVHCLQHFNTRFQLTSWMGPLWMLICTFEQLNWEEVVP